MDESAVYIKMCEKSPLQELWKPEIGDWYTPKQDLFEDDWGSEWKLEGTELVFEKGKVYCAGSNNLSGFNTVYYCDWCGESGDFSLLIWLPRQDQLQDMVSIPLGALLRKFIESVLHHPEGSSFESCWVQDCYEQFNSMEQLWLVFVMQEKYNKTWNGEDWICQ